MSKTMLWGNIRYALRLFRRSPGFATVTVLSLALGIGGNTAIFSLLNAVMLQTLPVKHPEELVELLQQYPGEPRGGYWSWRSYEHIRNHAQVFSALTGTGFDNLMRVRAEGSESETVIGENVRANYFAFLGLKPALGRLIDVGDAPASGDGTVVVVSWSYWNSRFGRDPAIVGKRIYLGSAPKTVIGVAPRNYAGPRVGLRTDIWVPTEKDSVAILARLKPGVAITQARAEMAALYQFTIEERAAVSKDPLVRQLKVEVEPAGTGLSRIRDLYGKPLVLLMTGVGLLLLLACVNIASLLLARAAGRQREMAVRFGLGANRSHLVWQTFTESLLLSGAGTIAGGFLAWFATEVLVRIMASGRMHERVFLEVRPDLHLILFTGCVAVLTGSLFGIAPAWHAFQSAPMSGLRQTGSGGGTRGWKLFAKGLVVAQVGLSILLVSGAFIFGSHLSRLRNHDLGFRSDHVLLVQLEPEHSGYRRQQLVQPYQELLRRLKALPGVRSASITGCSPLQGCGASRFVTAEGFTERSEDRRFTALSWVAPAYFETLGIPLTAGRDFHLADVGRPRVAVISQSMAQYYFPGGNPIGKRLKIDRNPQTGGWYGDDQPYEVIGVVGDIKYSELREPPQRTMYFNMFQENRLSHQFVLRTSIDPASISEAVRHTVQQLLASVPVARMTTLSDQIDANIVPERLIATLSGFFGALAATLAGIGLYGLLAYTVASRISEIGVRLALGATAGGISRMVLGDALRMVAAGLAVGVPMVLWSLPLVRRLVEDLRVPSVTPIAFGTVAVVTLVLLVSCVPAWRASRVNPVDTLRRE